ncbi:MAG: Uma2 family endonuclease [Deltaproteobacteria bacterium]|nr:Uma2 family endonuclease [Deltaproteobacteria bacterium]
MSLARTPARFTLEEFLALEETSPERHEFVDGTIYAMTGGTVAHADLCGNVFTALKTRLRGKPCRPYNVDLRLFIPELNIATYPDVAVYCGPLQLHGKRNDTAVNPTLIVEVLSPSTRTYDRGEKFDAYQRIPTLKQYVLVHQERAIVETFTRVAPAVWEPAMVRGLHATVALASIDVELPLQDLFEGVPLVD